MARTRYLPQADAEFLGFARNFLKFQSDPQAVGLTASDAATYAAAMEAFAAALRVTHDPITRGPYATSVKNTAGAALRSLSQRLAMVVQHHPGVTDDQRVWLGLTVRQKGPRRVGRPRVVPILSARAVSGSRVQLVLQDAQGNAKRLPAGVAGAFVYAHVGRTMPDDMSDWRFHGATTGTTYRLTVGRGLLGEHGPGARVWFAAAWVNRRLKAGPACQAVCVDGLGYGLEPMLGVAA